jgi:hypothetical protein
VRHGQSTRAIKSAGLRVTGAGRPIPSASISDRKGIPRRSPSSRRSGESATAGAEPVYFTQGDRRVEQRDRSISLGKAWLVSRLQALLQTTRILLLRTMEAQALAQELLDYEIHVDEKANDTYGAFRVGSHDDLVTALGLAVQEPVRQCRITWTDGYDVYEGNELAISPHYWRHGRR